MATGDKLISLRVNVDKIDPKRIFKGEKGRYLDMQFWLNEETDSYGNNGMIVQSVSKEEREAGTKGNILGNAKILNKGTGAGTPEAQPQQYGTKPKADDEPVDDLPF